MSHSVILHRLQRLRRGAGSLCLAKANSEMMSFKGVSLQASGAGDVHAAKLSNKQGQAEGRACRPGRWGGLWRCLSQPR